MVRIRMGSMALAGLVLLAGLAGCSGNSGGGGSGQSFSIGGNLTGLAAGQSVTLQNNGGDDLVLDSNGAFEFAAELDDGENYDVQVSADPAGQSCAPSSNSGAVAGADVDTVLVTCIDANASGTLDTSFNPGGATPGIVTDDINATGASKNLAFDIEIDATGRILAVGSSFQHPNADDMAIWRFNADGSPDTTFSGDGFVNDHGVAGGTTEIANAMAIDAEGNVLVTGRAINGTTGFNDMATWRYTSAGAPDTEFSGDGRVTSQDAAGGGLTTTGEDIAVDSEGNVIVVGDGHNGSNHDIVVWRYTGAGALDTSFAGQGFVIEGPVTSGDWDDQANGVAIDSSDRILVTGESISDTGQAMVLLRFDTDGSLDTSFNTTGVVAFEPVASNFYAGEAIVIDSSNRILVAGFATGGGGADAAIWRYLADGTLDTTFSDGDTTPGYAQIPISTSSTMADFAFGMALDGSHRILVTGFNANATTSNDMFLLRLTADGDLDVSFNPGGSQPGVLTFHDAAGGDLSDQGYGVAVDTNGKIVVGGNSTAAHGNPDMTLWRFHP